MSATNLRTLLEGDDMLVAPGVFDGLTATIVEEIGFDAAYLGGWATGASTAITEPIVGAAEMCQRASEIVENVQIPLLVDGNAGFGNAPHTYRAVNKYATTGIAGIHIEDQVYPKRLHYHAGRRHGGQKHISDVSHMEHKIGAANEAKRDNDTDIVIVARSDAGRGQRREQHDETIDDAIHRVNSYLDAGAEAAMVFPQSTEELERAVDDIDGPLILTLVEERDPDLTVSELDEIGVGMTIYALSASIKTADAIREMYTELMENGHTGLGDEEYDRVKDYVKECIGLPRYFDIESREGKK
jgi:methylisocitrate lyase